MLGALALAGAALNAVGGYAGALGALQISAIYPLGALELLVLVEKLDERGDGDVLRAGIDAVAAAGAADARNSPDYRHDLFDSLVFGVGERLKIGEGRGVVEYLLLGVHTAEYHEQALERAAEAHRPRGP